MNFFLQNRLKLVDYIDNDSIMVLFAGKAPVKIGDERYAFTPNRNFYYMTGIDKQNIILLIVKKDNILNEFLFIERFDELKAKWVGAVINAKECTEISQIKNIVYIDEFYEKLSSIIFSDRIKNVYIDLENRYFNSERIEIKFAESLKSKYPYLNIKNVYNIIAEFRMIKSDFEIENIKKAIDITKNGIYNMMKNSKAGMYEYEIEAYFDFILKKSGVKDKAFASIAATGNNATILHYSNNNSKTKDGDLILFDVGAQYGYYSADITRTFPVNGRFSERQKQIYNIVLEGRNKVINAIKPNIEFKALNQILIQHYYNELKKIGMIEAIEDVSKYYYHSVSHLLGLETHDVGRGNEGKLKIGMVLTVEPGLYIEDEGIGIRIEDDVVVTNNGCEVLSKDIIRTVEDIENFILLKND